jgi:putative transposase
VCLRPPTKFAFRHSFVLRHSSIVLEPDVQSLRQAAVVATGLWPVRLRRNQRARRPTGPWLQVQSLRQAAVVATGLWPVRLRQSSKNSTAHRAVATGFWVKQEFERRPLRLARVFDGNPLYFVTFCTHSRTPWLALNEIHAAFVLFAEKAERDFGIAVGRYVIMPDHVHLFVRGGPDFVLGRWVGMLKQSLGQATKLSRRDMQLWQEGFFDHVLRSDDSYAQKWQYVRENPARAGLLSCSEDWPYQGEIVHIDRA